MRTVFARVLILIGSLGCNRGRVTDVQHEPRDLEKYESAVVHASAGRDVDVKREEIVELEGEIVQRLQEGKVFARVSRTDAAAQAAVNVVVDRLEDTSNPLAINGQTHAAAHATVEVVDVGANRIVGQFGIEGADTDRPAILTGGAEKGGPRTIALRNVARAAVKKLRASR